MNIVLVEDSESLCERLTELLEAMNHHVSVLPARKAETLSRTARSGYDLALVDRRASDHEDQNDVSGDEIARVLRSHGLPAVLLTRSMPAHDHLFELLRSDAVSGVIDLSVPMPEIAACINTYRRGHRFANGIAHFEMKSDSDDVSTARPKPTTFWQEVRKHVEGGGRHFSDEEYAVLFRRLIPPCTKKVTIERLAPGRGGGAVVRASLSFGDGPLKEDLAVKYGTRTRIFSEAMHYDRFVGPLPDGVAAQLRLRAETSHLGALAYSWVGNSIEDGVPLGPPSAQSAIITWPRRRKVIEHLFTVSVQPWYGVYRSVAGESDGSVSLLRHYVGRGGLWYQTLGELHALRIPPDDVSLVSNVVCSEDTWDFVRFGVLPSPVKWAEGFGRKPIGRLAPCHGDLHVKNIYALPDDSARLIDFGSTTLGHIFRDFAALEVSLRLTCVEDDDPAVLKAAEDRLCETRGLGQPIDGRGLGATASLREAIAATASIRQAAFDAKAYHMNEIEALQEYFFAVVLHMLRYASGIADEVSAKHDRRRDLRIWHSMYGAARAAKAAFDLPKTVDDRQDHNGSFGSGT
jgi:DNA-binding response OmpR family regulator